MEKGRERVARVAVWIAMAAWCLWGSAALGQLHGEISMAKDVYLAGEPVYVHFEVTNTGKDAVQYLTDGDPYVEECSGYEIEVLTGPAVKHPSCQRGKLASCLSGNDLLAPGATLRQNLLVNYAHDVSKPGKYEIRATQGLTYGVAGELLKAAGSKVFRVEKRFEIEVVPGSHEQLENVYRVYMKNLESDDPDIERDAERAIVSGAPAWLEETIIGMLRRYNTRELALLGLKNLNTARSREELAKIVENSSEYTGENLTAVGYLAQMGDKKYFPLLLGIAKKQPADQGQEYVLAAAELGGDEAVPYLRALLGSAEARERTKGVLGLKKTGSREAVPVLIAALKDANADVGRMAASGLTVLTHRAASVNRSEMSDPPAEHYGEWSKWWEANGSSAKVYGPRECGEVEELR